MDGFRNDVNEIGRICKNGRYVVPDLLVKVVEIFRFAFRLTTAVVAGAVVVSTVVVAVVVVAICFSLLLIRRSR